MTGRVDASHDHAAEDLAARIRALIPGHDPSDERRMFGGRAFMVAGKMAVAIIGSGEVMIRLDPDEAQRAVDAGEAGVMEMRGRAIAGWVRLASTSDAELARWVARGVDRARSLAS